MFCRCPSTTSFIWPCIFAGHVRCFSATTCFIFIGFANTRSRPEVDNRRHIISCFCDTWQLQWSSETWTGCVAQQHLDTSRPQLNRGSFHFSRSPSCEPRRSFAWRGGVQRVRSLHRCCWDQCAGETTSRDSRKFTAVVKKQSNQQCWPWISINGCKSAWDLDCCVSVFMHLWHSGRQQSASKHRKTHSYVPSLTLSTGFLLHVVFMWNMFWQTLYAFKRMCLRCRYMLCWNRERAAFFQCVKQQCQNIGSIWMASHHIPTCCIGSCGIHLLRINLAALISLYVIQTKLQYSACILISIEITASWSNKSENGGKHWSGVEKKWIILKMWQGNVFFIVCVSGCHW